MSDKLQFVVLFSSNLRGGSHRQTEVYRTFLTCSVRNINAGTDRSNRSQCGRSLRLVRLLQMADLVHSVVDQF